MPIDIADPRLTRKEREQLRAIIARLAKIPAYGRWLDRGPDIVTKADVDATRPEDTKDGS
jgi:hypothetical protein